MIWTTTPWTLPANQAVCVHPDFDYNLVDTPRGYVIVAADLQDACLKRFALAGTTVATTKGAALEHLVFRHPFYDRASPVYLGEYVTLEQGTGVVHSAPAYGVEDFESCRRYGMKDDEILGAGDGRRALRLSLPYFGGLLIWEANAEVVARLREVGVLFAATRPRAQLHALLAPQDAGYLPRDARSGSSAWTSPGAHRRPSPGRRCAERMRAIEARSFYPEWGTARASSR